MLKPPFYKGLDEVSPKLPRLSDGGWFKVRQVCDDFFIQLCMFYQIDEADTIIMEKDELKRVLETLIACGDLRIEECSKGGDVFVAG